MQTVAMGASMQTVATGATLRCSKFHQVMLICFLQAALDAGQ